MQPTNFKPAALSSIAPYLHGY